MHRSHNQKHNERQMRSKSVVHVTTLGWSAKLFLLDHFNCLSRAGFETVLVCADDEDARRTVQATGVRFVPVPMRQNISPFADCVSLFRLWRLFRLLRPTIVDAHMSKAGLLGSLAAWLAGVPIRIYHSHGMAVLSAHGWKYWLLWTTECLACRLATEVIFVSNSNRHDITSIGICPKERAVVLGPGTICGIDIDRFSAETASQHGTKLRLQAGISPDSQIVGFVARIVPHKGIETILQAWHFLPVDIRANAYLCLFGPYGDRRMKDLVKQAVSEPESHVKYMGFVDNLPEWYPTMTLLVQPSWHEGWGYNVLEAAACGVPAVGTRISGTVDAILDGQTGLLVPVKDPKAMADAIARLLQDDRLRKSLGRAARERAVNEFSKERICPLLTQEYERLLGRTRIYEPQHA